MGILSGRVAIVTGASSGIGYGCALRFAEEGANVIACARRLDRLGRLAEEAVEKGCEGKIVPAACDVGNERDLDTIVELAISEFGKIDILACIAQGGMNNQQYIMETKSEDAIEFYKTGPLYTMYLIQKCVPHMKEQNYGRIITCASGSAVTGTPGYTGYALAKASIQALTRISAQEFGRFGIVTNCFLPVIMNDNYGIDEQSGQALELLKQVSPVGYVGDAYKDCSPIVAFMASEGAHYLNGQMIGICGGVQMLA